MNNANEWSREVELTTNFKTRFQQWRYDCNKRGPILPLVETVIFKWMYSRATDYIAKNPVECYGTSHTQIILNILDNPKLRDEIFPLNYFEKCSVEEFKRLTNVSDLDHTNRNLMYSLMYSVQLGL